MRLLLTSLAEAVSAVAVWDAHTPGAGADETDGPFMLKAGR